MAPNIREPETTAPLQSRRAARAGKWLLAIGLVAVVAVVLWLVDLQALVIWMEESVARLGVLGPILFITAYVLSAVLFVPGSALTIAAGTLFGVVWGSIYVSIASTIGATLSFLLGRGLLRGVIAQKIEGNGKFAAIDRAVAREGWKIVGLTRLSPIFPFNLLNYAYGLTNVRLRDFVLASWIGMMPGTVLYVYLGAIGKAAADSQGRTSSEWALLGVGLLATVAVTYYVTRIAKRALADRI